MQCRIQCNVQLDRQLRQQKHQKLYDVFVQYYTTKRKWKHNIYLMHILVRHSHTTRSRLNMQQIKTILASIDNDIRALRMYLSTYDFVDVRWWLAVAPRDQRQRGSETSSTSSRTAHRVRCRGRLFVPDVSPNRENHRWQIMPEKSHSYNYISLSLETKRKDASNDEQNLPSISQISQATSTGALSSRAVSMRYELRRLRVRELRRRRRQCLRMRAIISTINRTTLRTQPIFQHPVVHNTLFMIFLF